MGYLLAFYLRNGIHSRRTYWMATLGLFPVGCSMLLWMVKPLLESEGESLFGLFPQFGQLLFLNVLIPLMAIFVGAAVIADEVEERTLPYLLTRPVKRGKIVLAKLLSGAVTLGVILAVSLFMIYSVLVLEGGSGGWGGNISSLLQCEGVMMLGLAAYLPFFAVIGGIMKRPVLVGLLLVFGWERLVALLPGNIKLLTIVHYLHVLYPAGTAGRGGDIRSALFDTAMPATEVSNFLAVLILLAITALFTTLAMALLQIKEYRLEQSE